MHYSLLYRSPLAYYQTISTQYLIHPFYLLLIACIDYYKCNSVKYLLVSILYITFVNQMFKI